jgi:hypothetical protein
MAWVRELGSSLRAALIMILLLAVVLLDSVSRIISMFEDGVCVALILVLIWPLLKNQKEPPAVK